MTADNTYARQYSKALFKIALEQKELNRWLSDLRKMAGMVRDEAVVKVLENREIPFESKTKVLTERVGEINPEMLKLVSMLASKGNLDLIIDIADEYQLLVDSYHGIEGVEIAEVTTAIPLDDEDRLGLGKRLTDLLGKPVVIKAKVDPDLIGGIVIRMGDKLIDASIRSKLETLKRTLEKK